MKVYIKYVAPRRGEYSVEYLQDFLTGANCGVTFSNSFLEGVYIFGLLDGTEEAIGKIWNVLDKRFCAIELTSDEYTGAAVGAYVEEPDEAVDPEKPVGPDNPLKPKIRTFKGWMAEQYITVEDKDIAAKKKAYDDYIVTEIAVRAKNLDDRIAVKV